ncbi:MAG: hypothetical protein Q9222_003423 [Ikaeria aurantiellina]
MDATSQTNEGTDSLSAPGQSSKQHPSPAQTEALEMLRRAVPDDLERIALVTEDARVRRNKPSAIQSTIPQSHSSSDHLQQAGSSAAPDAQTVAATQTPSRPKTYRERMEERKTRPPITAPPGYNSGLAADLARLARGSKKEDEPGNAPSPEPESKKRRMEPGI